MSDALVIVGGTPEWAVAIAALRRIEAGHPSGDCGCSHDDENCCARVGEWCAVCIAAEALAALVSRPEPREPEISRILSELDRLRVGHLGGREQLDKLDVLAVFQRQGCACRCCDHGEGSDCGCNCHSEGDCSAVRPVLSAPSSRYPIRAHVEGCPKALRVPVDLCDCGGRDVTPDPSASAPSPDYVQVLKAAKAVVNNSVLYKKFIDGTPLENDLAVWMADFVFAQLKTE